MRAKKNQKRDPNLVTEYTGTPISVDNQDQAEILSEQDLENMDNLEGKEEKASD